MENNFARIYIITGKSGSANVVNNTEKFDCIEDALDSYKECLSAADRKVKLSDEIMKKLREDFDECVNDMTDTSAEEFNETIINIIKKAYKVQLYGYDD